MTERGGGGGGRDKSLLAWLDQRTMEGTSTTVLAVVLPRLQYYYYHYSLPSPEHLLDFEYPLSTSSSYCTVVRKGRVVSPYRKRQKFVEDICKLIAISFCVCL